MTLGYIEEYMQTLMLLVERQPASAPKVLRLIVTLVWKGCSLVLWRNSAPPAQAARLLRNVESTMTPAAPAAKFMAPPLPLGESLLPQGFVAWQLSKRHA